MEPPPPDVAASIVRGLGLYLRSAPVGDIPKELRRFRGFRPSTLPRHGDRLLAALDDAALRAAVLEWLDDSRPKLSQSDARNLRLSLERPEGWRDQLASVTNDRPAQRATPGSRDGALEMERARARSARDELKRARQRARAELDAAGARTADLAKEIKRLTAAVSQAQEAVRKERASTDSARTQLERERRRMRRDVDKARAERDESKGSARVARRELTAANREIERLRRRVAQLEQDGARPPAAPATRAVAKSRKRRPLPVPKGRLPEDPQTLDEWLARPRVHLVVDGYNAARAESAFGELDLGGQRERLIQEVFLLAVRRGAAATIVFDGAEIAPGTKRRRRGPVTIEYSKASETADDHMVALLERMPPEPVVVVTNDRELRERTAALGATLATSDQLMGLVR